MNRCFREVLNSSCQQRAELSLIEGIVSSVLATTVFWQYFQNLAFCSCVTSPIYWAPRQWEKLATGKAQTPRVTAFWLLQNLALQSCQPLPCLVHLIWRNCPTLVPPHLLIFAFPLYHVSTAPNHDTSSGQSYLWRRKAINLPQ